MHQKIRICGDTQIEHVLARLCLGTNKVNHILRVHGLGLWQDGHTLKKFDECQKSTLDRLVPGLSEQGHQQAALGAKVGGLGWRPAVDIALAANLGALISAAPKITAMVLAVLLKIACS